MQVMRMDLYVFLRVEEADVSLADPDTGGASPRQVTAGIRSRVAKTLSKRSYSHSSSIGIHILKDKQGTKVVTYIQPCILEHRKR